MQITKTLPGKVFVAFTVLAVINRFTSQHAFHLGPECVPCMVDLTLALAWLFLLLRKKQASPETVEVVPDECKCLEARRGAHVLSRPTSSRRPDAAQPGAPPQDRYVGSIHFTNSPYARLPSEGDD